MKPNYLFTSMLAVTALFVASCSTSKLAQNNAIQDDVYNTTAQAREYKEMAAPVQSTAVNGQTDGQVDDYYGTSDPYYDMDYTTRINRFYYANPWRTYYDGYYGFSPFDFNSFYSPFYSGGFGWNMGWNTGWNMGWNMGMNNFYNSYAYWGLYGAPYFNNYWGLYSYNNPYNWGWGGGGWGGGGYFGSIGGGVVRNNGNYGPRPTRGSENGIRTSRSGYDGSNGLPDRVSSSGSRAERYNPNNGNAGTTRPNGTSNPTSRPNNGDSSRPTRSNDAPTRTYNPPTQSAPPPSSSSSGSRGESGSSSSGGGGGGGRPTRGGGR